MDDWEKSENLIFPCETNGRCLACAEYGRCTRAERAAFGREELHKLRHTIWYKCRHKNRPAYCSVCPRYKDCVSERGLPYKRYERKNVVINVFPDSEKIEVVYYKRPFLHLEESENLDDVARQRMLRLNEQGVYEPIGDDFSVQALQRSIRNATKRSKDTFYGFALANDWEYFVTLTFSPEVVDRHDDLAVKALYSDFQRWCKRKSPDVKMLMVPERHKDGAIHFHGLISEIRFDLVPAVDPHTKKPLFSACGSPLFSIRDWKYGISTLAVIPKEDNCKKVVNYMEKYIAKDGNIGYGQKRFYRTRNLLFKNKSIYYCAGTDLDALVLELGLEPVKDNDKLIIYRKKEGHI